MAEIMVALSSDDQTISVPLATVFGTGIARIEQTVTSEDPEIPNEITCTLTNGQQSKFYIKNGKDGYSPSITIEQGAEGYSITVTDEEGSHEYSIIVDSTLDAESANPIQNQAVATAISNLLTAVATKASLEAERQARISAVDSVGNAVTSVGNDLRSETTRAQSEEARIEGLTSDTVKYTKQTLTDAQKRQALANLDAASNTALNGMSASFNASLGAVANRVTEEITRATQAESDIRSSIPTSAQISALAPVQSVNGMTGAVTLPTATTSADGLMSSTDKSRLDALYADYSSALSALGV